MISFVTQKVVQYFIVLLLFQTSLLSNNTFFSKIDLHKIDRLSTDNQWHRLLHFKNRQSEIDDPAFFFSKHGKRDPKAELEASINKILLDKSDDKNSTLCRYPSRSAWIIEKFPELKKNIYIPECISINKELKELNAHYVTLILASAHINSPASAFGHTFLRIDSDKETPLLSYAVNYAAQTNEENGLVYAYKGLFGGYEGRYSIDPYYQKLKEYVDLEQRDIWEYTLDLSQEEMHRMILHIFEIRHFYADYFFTNENCSYNILWLIDVATQKSNLIPQFNYKAIPLDTLRAVISEKLVKKVIYRPSKRKKILALSEAIQNNSQALKFAKSEDYNLSLIQYLSTKEKIASVELATALLKIKRSKNELSKKEYLHKFLKILRYRSKLGKIEKKIIPQPSSPKEGHLSTKASLAYNNHQITTGQIKIAYHDIYDNESGYIPGAYVNFFDTKIDYKENRVTLDKLNLIDIRSYAIQDAIFKPISWQVTFGGKRIFNNELNAYIKTGAGITLGNEKLFGFATLTPTLYYREKGDYSISTNAGLLYNPSSSIKFGLLGTKEWFDKARTIEEIEPFITYSFDQTSALNLHYKYKKMNSVQENEMQLSWFWYF